MLITLTPSTTNTNSNHIENYPTFSIGDQVKLFDKGEHSTTYKIYAIGISSMEQDEENGFIEATYIYAIYDADSKIPTS